MLDIKLDYRGYILFAGGTIICIFSIIAAGVFHSLLPLLILIPGFAIVVVSRFYIFTTFIEIADDFFILGNGWKLRPTHKFYYNDIVSIQIRSTIPNMIIITKDKVTGVVKKNGFHMTRWYDTGPYPFSTVEDEKLDKIAKKCEVYQVQEGFFFRQKGKKKWHRN